MDQKRLVSSNYHLHVFRLVGIYMDRAREVIYPQMALFLPLIED